MTRNLVKLSIVLILFFIVLGSSFRTRAYPAYLRQAVKFGAKNCLFCHSKPEGGEGWNARGQWLISEKERRKADEVDVQWLAEYKEGENTVGATKESATKENAAKENETKESATKENATKEDATKENATKENATKEGETKESATKESGSHKEGEDVEGDKPDGDKKDAEADKKQNKRMKRNPKVQKKEAKPE
jgi:hypothetical protein